MPATRLAILALLVPLAACETLATQDVPVAKSNLIRSDGTAMGTLEVYQQTTGVLLRINATGLPPGQHGVHVHTTGRCDTPSFDSAGGHWNPTNMQHGHRDPQGPHMGDLGNLGVGADGRLVAGLLIPGAALWSNSGRGPALRDADGAALVIHAQPDDQVTDPSGNSGARIACAVI